MDALSPSSRYERVVFMKGAQLGATEAGLNWIGYVIDIAPKPTMIVWPTDQNIKDNSQIRLKPLLEDCPTIAGKIAAQHGTRDPANNTFLKEFPGGHLTCAASNSSAALRSKPICNLMLDEVDEYPGNVNQQGDPINLAIARTRTYSGRRKILIVSTPTISGNSRIEKAFDQTDKRRFYVPCPHCGAFQVLVFRQLRWEKGRPDKAYYSCEHCEGRIENYHKPEMLAKGKWRAEAAEQSGKIIGFHLSSLYSPVGMFSWGEIATKWEEDRHDSNRRREFMNTVLGLPYVEDSDLPEWEKLYERREPYEFGIVPENGLFLTAGADVQKDRIECIIVAWGRDKENWTVDYKTFAGDTSDIASDAWRGLDLLMTNGFEHESGCTLHIRTLGIDTGFNTQVVYNWARRFQEGRVMPIKGEDSLSMIISQPRAVDVYQNGKRKRGAMKMYRVGVSLIKQELYGWLNLPRPEAGLAPPPGYCHFPEFDEEFFRQLCSEQLVVTETRLTKRQVRSWKKLRDRNEVLDCFIYARAAAALLKIDMFKSAHWDLLERALWPSGKPISGEKREESETHGPAVTENQRFKRSGIVSRGVRI
jgi:phage terminase large subunit GpA-like protein